MPKEPPYHFLTVPDIGPNHAKRKTITKTKFNPIAFKHLIIFNIYKKAFIDAEV